MFAIYYKMSSMTHMPLVLHKRCSEGLEEVDNVCNSDQTILACLKSFNQGLLIERFNTFVIVQYLCLNVCFTRDTILRRIGENLDSGKKIFKLVGCETFPRLRRTYQMPEKGNELNWDKEQWNKLGQIMFTLLLFANCCNIVLFAESSWGLSVLT